MITAVPFVAQIGNMFVQLTLLTFYCRLAPIRVLHYICYFLMFLSALMSILRVTFSSILCFHIHPDDGLICHDNMTLIKIHAAMGIGTNVIIFIIPIPLLWGLKNVSVMRRLGLIFIFSVGLIAVGACLTKIFVFKMVMESGDPSWGMPWIAILCQIEVGAGITCTCLPMVRPLLLNTRLFSKRTPPMGDAPKAEQGGGSGDGTTLLRRAKTGWEGKSLTTTWQGVHRYYHTRWGRKRSIIEVADLEGVGVLSSHCEYPDHPGGGGKAGHFVSGSCEVRSSQLGGDMEFGCQGNQTPSERTPLPPLTLVSSCHKPGVSRDESRHLSKFQLSTASQKGESTEPPRRPKTSDSGDAVLLSSMAPIADGGSSEGGGMSISTSAKTESSTSTLPCQEG